MKSGVILILLFLLFGIAGGTYKWCEVPRSRIYGKYEIDRKFYPGGNADWQHSLFNFQITKNDEFIFTEKLKDGSRKDIRGNIEWYRISTPHLFKIAGTTSSLIDEYPSHYRGNCKFYFVFQTKYGNMFYRKTSS